ncbi:myelin-associated glycoprotein-like isoform X5 [Sebastes umbrosus]|uniref:myelin-associated glycoprotein-like isoform X5 n=1 Tax=Sebastes umbrosus TaxID=72105 RepID=UPI00189ECABE|nr:myelin-associated glycoprotein-like isoform X5 [Sebastes umbrosus]XP_037642065.1 myelin-associated glycoprotein-like isoform X6 [Sebastes umbrosus]XP_037642066.1 myelin-associated glycoprotein-like isoform X5 [Sebastes umbrosus]
MAAALTLLIGSLLQGALCGEFKALMPQTIEVLSGSCVTIPCSFDVTAQYESNLDSTCKAVWKKDRSTVVFDSGNSQQTTIKGELKGDLTRKDCTTTLNNMQPSYTNNYFFKVECNNNLKNDFLQQISISVKADPPRPTLTPSTLKLKEGTSVSLMCSAPAPCLSHPPTLTWTSGLGDSQETLQENQDKTKVKTSVVTFTASHHHHGKTISCTAVYSKQDGSTESTVRTSLTADVSCALCGDWGALMPQTMEVLSGSCVTIPCSFTIQDSFKSNLDSTCNAVWKNDQGTFVFDSSNPQQLTIKRELTGDLTRKDCTTTLNNMQPSYSDNYCFRIECNGLKYNFIEQISISVKADPPRPTLTPSTLKVKEGTSVSLMCSAPAPCLSHPPTLMWTSGLGVSQETLQENQDKTKVKTSVVNFTASHHHHGKTISCTAVYNKQDGSTESTVITSLTADVSYSPKDTTVSVHPSGPVPEGSNVTLTCSSTANPAVRSYTWYRADGGQETVVGTGHVLTIKASKDDGPFFCKAQNDIGAGRSDNSHIDVQYSPKNTTVSVHPSGPVPEGRDVTLTCSSTANPAVRSYTWYRADGGQEIVVGTGHVLTIKASKDDGPFFCQAENDIGAGRSDLTQIDVQYSPKNTTVSVHPSGPVPEGRDVTLTCSSTANPAVRSYTWYRADGGQETVIGTGHVLIIKASKDNGPFFCQAENDIGAGRSNLTQIDVQFAPQILPSSDCTKTAAQLSCSCRTVGNPSPTLEWYLDGLPVNHTGKLLISNESLNDTGLRSIITVNQPQETDLSTLLCRSSNSLGSASQRFCVNSLEPQTSAHSHDRVTLPVFITTVVTLLVLVCALLFVNRAQKTQRNLPKSQCTDDTSAVTMSQPLTSGEGNEVPNTAEEDIYVNTNALRQTDVAQPATVSEPDSANLPSSGPNNAEGASKSSEKKKEENDVIYSSVNWKTKSKKKTGEDCVDMYQPVRSHLEEERCMVGGTSRSFVNASEMGILYDTVKPGNVEKEVESEYAQVKFKDKSSMHK